MDCPKNASNWKRRADNLRCQHNDVYHCLLLEDKSKVKEVCIERTLINQGKFNTQIYFIHVTNFNRNKHIYLVLEF